MGSDAADVTPETTELRVEHTRTRAQGRVLDTAGRGRAATCRVEFEHGIEEVAKALLRPLWQPFQLLRDSQVVHPYWRWLQRERFRLLDAYHNDLALGLSNSRVEPQLHQVSVALRALEKSQPRLILADEVGLGKTIEAGLILKELRARMGAELARVLVVVPASLVSQWRFELESKFNERFVFLDGAAVARIRTERPGENPWAVEPNVICSLQLARRDKHADDISTAPWDLVIVDEAHHARRTLG
jgi:SNF2 family DNA or RNA helicase